jgi:small subunit ribosomal protein S2
MFFKTVLTYNQLIKHNVHIGHSLKNTLLLASWMLFGIRQDIWLINIDKTLSIFRISFSVLRHIVSARGPVWFINLDVSVEKFIRFFALRSGEFFCSSGWIRGLLSNYMTVGTQYCLHAGSRFKDLAKRPSNVYYNFFLTRLTWPRAAFISGAKQSLQAVKECRTMNIPCIAICDTNFPSHYVNFAVPGNDDSIDAIIFYNSIISQFIVYLKFCSVFLWFINVKRFSRLKSFEKWISQSFLHLKLNKYSLLNIPSSLDFFYNSFLFLFSFFKKTEPTSMFRLFSFEIYNFKGSFSFFLKNKLYCLRLLNSHFLKNILSLPLLWVRGRFLKILNKESFSAKYSKSRLALDKVLLSNEWFNHRSLLINFYFFCSIRLFQARARKFLKKWFYFYIFVYCKLLLKACGALNMLSKIPDSQRRLLFNKLLINKNRKLLINKNRKLLINKKVSFFIGWFSFKQIVAGYNWCRNDFSIFFSRRIINEWIWYFWRVNQKNLKVNLYKGPGFFSSFYNYNFLPSIENNFDVDIVDFSWLESSYFYLNCFFEIEFLNFINFDFLKNDSFFLEQKKIDFLYLNLQKRIKFIFWFFAKRYQALCLFDRRFDLIRASLRAISLLRSKFYLKNLKRIKFLFLTFSKILKIYNDLNSCKKARFMKRCIFFFIKKIKENKKS